MWIFLGSMANGGIQYVQSFFSLGANCPYMGIREIRMGWDWEMGFTGGYANYPEFFRIILSDTRGKIVRLGIC